MKISIVAAVIVIVACSTPSAVAPLTIPLQYKTMASPAEFPTLPACAALSKTEVKDAQDEKALGRRFVEGKNAPAATVTTTSDVPACASSSSGAADHHHVDASASLPLSMTLDALA